MRNLYILIISIVFYGLYSTAQAQITGDTAVCTGDMATYNVSVMPGASYSWSVSGGNITGSSTADSVVINWGLPGTGSLFVTITPPNASPQAFFLTVSIYPAPNPLITHAPYPGCPPEQGEHAGGSPDQGGGDGCEKVCKYATITYYTANNTGSTYSWVVTGAQTVTGAATSSVTVTWDASVTGSLTVYETNQWGCTDSSYLCIKKVNLPVAAFSHQLSVCKLSTVPFTNLSSGAVSYQWDFGDGGTSTAENPTHVYANGGTYTITLIAISECFCSDTVTSTISVSSNPGPEISCPSTLCAFDTATYSTSAAGCNYNWFVIGGTIIGPSNQQSVTVAWGAGQMGSLGLYVTGCAGFCVDTTWINIPIVPAVATISGPTKVCPGDCEEFSLPLFSGATYNWSLNSGSCGQITDSSCCNKVQICWPPFSGPCVDTLTVTYWDGFLNCGGTATFPIRVRPRLSVFGQAQGCSNGTSNFYAFPGVNSNWTVTPAGPVINASPAPSIIIDWNGLTGNFIVTATPVNPNATCNDSAFTAVNVISPPSAPVITGDTVTCPNNTIQYCATGSGTINWIITGGTPSSGTGNCINVTWGNTPPFLVQAYTQMPLAPYCSSDTATQNIYTVVSIPPAVFSGNHTACANATSSYSSTAPYLPGTGYNWSLTPANAGAVITGQGSPSIQVEWGNNAPQTVVLSLTTSLCGLNQTDTFHVHLKNPPNPSIVQIGTLCPGVNAQLQAVGGSFTAYQWSGPGGYSSSLNPTTISLPGLYQVTVTDAGGCTALTQINVSNVGAPEASISALGPLQYCIGSSYSVGLCALGNGNYTYSWSNGPTTQCNYVSSPGSYVVTVTDAVTGCYSVSNVMSVVEGPCQPDTGNCIPTGSVSFTHSSCNPKVFNNTSVNASSFTWFFGDMTSSNLVNPTHYYNQAGFYTVTLQGYVPDAAGTDSCLLVDTALIEIPLLAKFSFTSGCHGTPVCFTDQSVTTAGNFINNWSWNFGDANTSTLQNPCHTYANPGTYIVTLTISNPNCTTSITDTVTIAPPPLAAFGFNNTNCINTPVLFSDSSTTNINYWNWNFGNGGTSLNQNPSQSYTSSGFYPVTLIVHDIYGCYDTLTQNIFINVPQASGNITAFPDTVVCAGTSVTLAAPVCNGCTYNWSTGSVNDSITVTATGIYSVIVTDSNGCSYSTFINIIVHQPPYAIISSPDNELCMGEYTTLSVPYNPNWLYNWISNDPAVNGLTWQATNVFPASAGVYTYQVGITDTVTGCSDTTLPFVLVVHNPPVSPVITPLSPTTVCKGDTIILTVTHPDPTVTFTWSTGEINDTIYVTKNGCLSVVATDTNGCTANASFCITVNPLPEVCSFWEGCYDTCGPYVIQGPPGAASYQWLLNGLPLPGDTLPTLTATINGAYSVIVTNSFGCIDTTGILNLSLHPCPDSLCAELLIDTVFCDPATGLYVVQYQVVNHSNMPVTTVNLQILPPNLNVAYAPNMVYTYLNPGDTSAVFSSTIYNALPGSTLCFEGHISAYDYEGEESFCCGSDSVCITLPECGPDTLCCYFNILHDSIWCETGPDGTVQYHFEFLYEYCGEVEVSLAGQGILDIGNIFMLSPGIGYLSGTYVPGNPIQLCLTFLVHDGDYYCTDETYCFPLPPCPPPSLPCLWEYEHTICKGNIAWFQYFINVPGTTYTWQFPGGIPSSATGMGPHYILYPNTGTFPVQLTMTNQQGSTTCTDSITVVANPVASITLSGTSLLAGPAGFNYQWYTYPVSQATLISGATNQVFTPAVTGTYCVVVSNPYGCADTVCRDYFVEEPGCCDFNLISDSIWCVTSATGENEYHFILEIEGCGNMVITALNFGALNINNPITMTGGITTVTGTYVPVNDNTLCLLFMVNNEVTYCTDTTICFDLPPCQPVLLPCDYLTASFDTYVSGYTVNFSNTSTVENGMIQLAVAWNFGDTLSGLSNTSSLQYPSHIYSQPGTYVICMYVIAMYPGTNIFCVKQVCHTVTVTDIAQSACETLQPLFSMFISGLNAQFVNQSQSGNGLEITAYHWNFGDPASGNANFSELQNPAHQFSEPGFYTVCLAITAILEGTPLICYDTICVDYNIIPPSVIGGVIHYDNDLLTPMSDVTVNLWSGTTLIKTTQTNGSGEYEFDSLSAGIYRITCATTQPWGGVNATDALLILKHFVGITPLHGLRLTAANVDGMGLVNATDALLASRRFVGMVNSFTAGDWFFEQPLIPVEPNMNLSVDIKGICFGDVNGSYTPGLKTEPPVNLETQGNLYFKKGESALIPVKIKKDARVAAISLHLVLPENAMNITGITISHDPQNLVWNITGNELRLAWWTMDPLDLAEGDQLLAIQALIKGEITHENCCFSLGESTTLADFTGTEISGNTLVVPYLEYLPGEFSLGQNAPNPFSEKSKIEFYLPENGRLRLILSDVLGKTVEVLLDKDLAAGSHSLTLKGEELDNGVYYYSAYYTVENRKYHLSRKLVISH